VALETMSHYGGFVMSLASQSMDEEINAFADCVLNKKTMQGDISNNTFRTRQLFFKTYFADTTWRKLYDIPNPENH
jgi:hypothetical protein